MGITTAMVSRKAVVSHCAVLAVTPRSFISGWMATLMIVSLRKTTKVETSNNPMTSLLRAAVAGSTGAAMAASGASFRLSGVMSPLPCSAPNEGARAPGSPFGP